MKRDLYFSKPLMNAAGSLGFAPDSRAGVALESLGAFVTNPFSLRSRAPAAKPELIQYPGGFLLHTGLPNPGLNTGIKKYAARWDKSNVPIMVHLMADRPEETQRMVRMLESQENIMAAELGFAPLLANDIIRLTLEMSLGELPLIFSLPIEQVLSLGPRLIQEGAQAISISAPRGALPLTPGYALGSASRSMPRQSWDCRSSAQAGCGLKKTPTQSYRPARWLCKWTRPYGDLTGKINLLSSNQ